MKKIIIIIILLLVIAAAAIKLMAEKQKVATQPTALALNYTIATSAAQTRTVHQKRSFLANIKSDKEIQVMTKLSGVITKLYVSESDEVTKGDLLVKIDDTNLLSTLKTLKKTMEVQQSDVVYYTTVQNRNEKLYAAKAISKEKYDASVLQLLTKKATLEATKDKINATKSDLTYLQVRAPFTGVISSIYMHKGDLATAQKPILSLSANRQKMTFSFASTKENITIGDVVLVANKKVGTISKIYPNAKNNLNIAEVKLNKILKLKNDTFISIEVVLNSMTGCSVPLNALLHTKDANYVLGYKNNKFEKIQVTIPIEDDHYAIIEPCVKEKVALASESKLSILSFYKNISIVGSNHE